MPDCGRDELVKRHRALNYRTCASYAKPWRYEFNEFKEGGPPCKCLATGLCFSLSAQGAPQFFEAMGGAAVFSPSRRPLFYSRKPKPSLAGEPTSARLS